MIGKGLLNWAKKPVAAKGIGTGVMPNVNKPLSAPGIGANRVISKPAINPNEASIITGVADTDKTRAFAMNQTSATDKALQDARARANAVKAQQQIKPMQAPVSAPKPQVSVPQVSRLPVAPVNSGPVGGVAGAKERVAQMRQVSQANKAAAPAAAGFPDNANTQPVTNVPESAAAPSTPALPDQMTALRQAYLDSLKFSPNEDKAYDELNQLNSEANAAIYDVDATGSERGFTTGYATGVKGALANRADIARMPLEARIANLQQARTSERDQNLAQIGFMQQDMTAQREQANSDNEAKRTIVLEAIKNGATQEQMAQILGAGSANDAIKFAGGLLKPKAAKQDYLTLSEGQTVFDPITGKAVYTNPKSGSSGGADEGDKILTPNELTELGIDTKNYGLTRTQAQQMLQSGQIGTKSNQQVVDQNTKALASLQELLNSPGLPGAIGAKGPSSLFGLLNDPIAGSASADFVGKLNQFKSQLILSVIPLLKGTGPITDKEQKILENSVAALDPNMKQETFKAELLKVQQALQESLLKAQQAPVGGGDQMIQQYQQKYPGLSPDVIRQIMQEEGVFNSPLSMGGNGSAKQIAAAIKHVESGGNYNAKGASTEGGAYQFMPATWRQWAGQYLGNANAPMSPQNQDMVAEAKIQDLLNQGHTPQQIALIWNGGQPVVKKGVNKYGVAYDSGAYANKVVGALRNQMG